MIRFTQMRDATGKVKDVIVVLTSMKVVKAEGEFESLLKIHTDITHLSAVERTQMYNALNLVINKNFSVVSKKPKKSWLNFWKSKIT